MRKLAKEILAARKNRFVSEWYNLRPILGNAN